MKKTREQQIADVHAKELFKARNMGFADVQSYRAHLGNLDRKASYLKKIERYTEAIARYTEDIARMKAWIDEFEKENEER